MRLGTAVLKVLLSVPCFYWGSCGWASHGQMPLLAAVPSNQRLVAYFLALVSPSSALTARHPTGRCALHTVRCTLCRDRGHRYALAVGIPARSRLVGSMSRERMPPVHVPCRFGVLLEPLRTAFSRMM